MMKITTHRSLTFAVVAFLMTMIKNVVATTTSGSSSSHSYPDDTNRLHHRMLLEEKELADRLFGGRVWRGGSGGGNHRQLSTTTTSSGATMLRDQGTRRRDQENEDLHDDGSDEGVPHYQAEDLDYFKNGMDPAFFEWVNPDEIVPGGTTCGFLKASLGSRKGETYPAVDVYVCARFAKTQPAAKGNIFVHQGGPVALSDSQGHFNEENKNDFNVWSIDQRGGGRSSPNFVIEECAHWHEIPEPLSYTSADEDVQIMKDYLELRKQASFRCWQVPEFHMEAEQEDGSVKEYHFLQYSGTRQLAEDIERMRLLMNAPAMHLWGVSYGTTVMATHATMFPESVGLFYIDSCESPDLTHWYQAYSAAVNVDQRINYAIFSCEARNALNPGSCPVEDLAKCIEDVSSLKTTPSLGFKDITVVLNSDPDQTQKFCDVAAEGDGDALVALYQEVVKNEQSSGDAPPMQEGSADEVGLSPSQPSAAFGPIYGNPDYGNFLGAFLSVIKQQDHSEPIYDANRFIKQVVEFGVLYNGAGTSQPTNMLFEEYAYGYGVVKAVPLPQLGSNVKGVIAGALYDQATPYVWTQQMKDRFRNTKLITSQSYIHTAVTNKQPECGDLVQHYFATGETPFTDGYICGDELPGVVPVIEIGEYWPL